MQALQPGVMQKITTFSVTQHTGRQVSHVLTHTQVEQRGGGGAGLDGEGVLICSLIYRDTFDSNSTAHTQLKKDVYKKWVGSPNH